MTRTFLGTSLFAGLLVCAPLVFAAQSVISMGEHEEVFTPDPKTCAVSDTCDLKRVMFHTSHQRIPPGNDTDMDFYATKFTASYETYRIGELEKYVFVQFLRGCSYYSELNATGGVERYFGISRLYFGQLQIAQHPEWSIDSVDNDPAYLTNPSIPDKRHYFYEWFASPEKWRKGESGTYYGEAMPPTPRLFVDDMPFPATFYRGGRAQNSSLEFLTCLYKASDVPMHTEDTHNMTFAPPITCAEWKHNFVYDHATEKVERPSTIVPMCQRQLTEKEEAINRAMRR